MKEVTLTLDEEVAHWAYVRADERKTSISGLIEEILRERMFEEDNYQAAMEQYLSHSPQVLRDSKSPYPSREELHGRQGIC